MNQESGIEPLSRFGSKRRTLLVLGGMLLGLLLAALDNPGQVDPDGIEQLIEDVLDVARGVALGFLDMATASCGTCDPGDPSQPDQVCEAQEAFDAADEVTGDLQGDWSAGDFDLDGTVGFSDFLLLAENFGSANEQ